MSQNPREASAPVERARALKLEKTVRRELDKEIKQVLQGIYELKGSPLTMGRMQEEAIAKRLSTLKLGQDRFRTEKSRKSMEDVECLVIEDGREIGRIVIESKRTKKWSDGYIEQLKGYMERENTEFGMLATKTMPDDALNNTVWRDGVLVVNVDQVEPAYIFLREHLKLKRALEEDYSSKFDQLEVRDQILEELKNSVTSGELDSIIVQIDEATETIDRKISKAENSLSRIFKSMRKSTDTIRKLTGKLVSEHIEKIRTQIIQQPSSPFLDLI